MSKKNIVLVLGAGASVPYGFLTGEALVDDICQNLPQRMMRLITHGYPAHIYRAEGEEFATRLRRARSLSIDLFLAQECNQDLRETGQIAVTMSLLGIESASRLQRAEDSEDDWYRHLVHHIVRGDFLPSGIITYNYDRSFEQYMFEALEEHRRRPAVIEFMKTLPVVHVHGSFGPLPWQPASSPQAQPVPYGVLAEGCDDASYRRIIIKASKQVSMVYDEPFELAVMSARQLLGQADAVVFLGFGYDEDNLRKLGLAETVAPGVPFYGTAYKLPQSRQERAKDTIQRLADADRKRHDVRLLDCKNKTLMDEYGWFV